jgi:choline-sulfatase
MTPSNLLFIMSDEHNRRIMGCDGHSMIRTPHMDSLAARGVRFTDAYCNSPICVPSRASFATGRYVHQIGFWDNAIPYDGSVPSWGHRLNQAGHTATSIGKLHFRSADDNNGFTEEIMPLHVVDGEGDLLGLIRDDTPPRKAALKLAEEAGPGDSSYQRYDERITAAAVDWLRQRAAVRTGKPWVLFVSLVCPHFPLLSRDEWYGLYPEDAVPWPMLYAEHERPRHPFTEATRRIAIYDEAFNEQRVRRAIAAYFGMVSFLDDNIGKLMRALEETGLIRDTRVIYTSDHGDNLGARGLWGKSNMYEDAAGVPLLMAGPGVPEGFVCREPVSLVDGFPTILDCVGAPPSPEDFDLPGASLFDVLRGHVGPRTVFSEYHASGSVTGAFMIRRGRYKYVYYAGMAPQLFDVVADPWEINDLAADPGWAGLRAACEADLRAVTDPEATDARARRDQRARIDAFGGREAILARGTFGHSPAPGDAPVYT